MRSIAGYDDLLEQIVDRVTHYLPTEPSNKSPPSYSSQENTDNHYWSEKNDETHNDRNVTGHASFFQGGILLTGSAGVGKTFLVSSVAHRLTTLHGNQNNKEHHEQQRYASSSWRIQWVSLYHFSTRLMESPFSSIEEIASWILPFSMTKQELYRGEDDDLLCRTLLVLDDLDLLFSTSSNSSEDGDNDVAGDALGNGGSTTVSTTTSSFSSEGKRIEAALLHLLDTVIDPAAVQVIGIARNSRMTGSSSLTKVNRLDCPFHMDPPTQWQREEILEQLLESLLNEEEQAACNTKDTNADRKLQIRSWAHNLATVTAGFVASDLAQLCLNAHLKAQAANSKATSWRQQQQQYPSDQEESYHETIEEWLAQQKEQLERSCEEKSTSVMKSIAPVSWDDLVDSAQAMVPSQLKYLDVVRPPMMVIEEEAMNIELSQFDDEKRQPHSITKRNELGYKEWYAHHEKCWKSFIGYGTLKKHVFRSIVLPWRQHLQRPSGNRNSANTATSANKSPSSSQSQQTIQPLPPPRGVVFHGPSGCGKTLAATCLGASCGLPMIRIRPADILNQWLGGSEAALRSIFQRARGAAPCVLFLDELDALATNRQNDDSDGGAADNTGVMSRLLSTFLNELDGISTGSSSGQSVLVIACTNRMESLDAALLRPGRLEEHIKVAPPSLDDLYTILQHYFSWHEKSDSTIIKGDKMQQTAVACREKFITARNENSRFVDDKVDLKELAARLVEKNLTGCITAATVEGLARESVLRCVRKQDCGRDPTISNDGEKYPVLVSSADIEEAIHALHLQT